MWKALVAATLAALAGGAALAESDAFQAFPDQRFDPMPKTSFSDVPFQIMSVKLTEMPGVPTAPALEEHRPDYGSRGLVHDVSPRTQIGETVSLSHDFVVSYGEIQSSDADVGLARFRKWVVQNPRQLCILCDGSIRDHYSDEEIEAMLKARQDETPERIAEGGSPDGLKTQIVTIEGANSYRLEDPGVLYVCAVQIQNGRTLPEPPDSGVSIGYLDEIQRRHCVKGILNSNFTSDFARRRAYRVDFKLRARANSKGPVTLFVQVQVFGVAAGVKNSYFTQVRGTSPVVTTVVEGDPAQTGRYAAGAYYYNCKRPLPPQAGRFWTHDEGDRIELYFQDGAEVGAEIFRYSGTIWQEDGDTLAYRAQGKQWEFTEEETFPQSAVDQANAAGPHFWTVAGELDPVTHRLRTMFGEALCGLQEDGNLKSIKRHWRPFQITYD